MKKVLMSLLLIAVLVVPLMVPVKAEAAKISKTKMTLYVGETAALKLAGAKGKVTWSSSKKSVAAISSKGKVTGKKAGIATITAKAGGKKYKCKVTVKYNYNTMIVDTYNWVVGIWNDGFCDIYHYVESGTDAVGREMNLQRTISKIEKAISEKHIYDDFINSLSSKKHKKLKELWKNIGKEVDYLYGRIKDETPRASDSTYEFDYQDFQNYMYDLMDFM